MSSQPSKRKRKRRESFEEERIRIVAENTGSISLRASGHSPRALTTVKTHILAPDSTLCRRCAAINPLCFSPGGGTRLARIINTHHPTYSFVDTCSLCQLLRAIIPDHRNIKPRSQSQINNFRVRLTYINGYDLLSLPSKTLVFEISWGRGYQRKYLVPQLGVECTVRLLQPDSINFGIIKEWVQCCRSSHSSPCEIENPQHVPYLKLIDCESRRIVEAKTTGASYVCLSYVWGQILNGESYHGILPQGLPTTIEDSITATLKLGFRYLWVDRYCINQQDNVEVFHQIRMMDRIYQNAEVTVIAAAGKDPSYGLPGVGSRSRELQPSGKIRNILMVSTPDNPVEFIRNSTWITRGWTYQEAFFSRRRLVFTDQQAYFECNRMSCTESLNYLPAHQITGSNQLFRSTYPNHGSAFPHGTGLKPWELYQRLSEYCTKKLTNGSDILNGIRGTLRAFEVKYGMYHCWGVPSLLSLSSMASEKALILDGLSWYTSEPSLRRDDFPSWSWTGWQWYYTQPRWNHLFYDRDPFEKFRLSDGVELSVQFCDGRLMFWKEAQSILQARGSQAQLSTFVCISAWTTRIRLSTSHYNRAETVAAIKHAKRATLRYFQAKILQKNGEYVDLDDLVRMPKTPLPHLSASWFELGFLSTGHFEELPEFCVGIHLGDTSDPDFMDVIRNPFQREAKSFVLLVVGEVSEGKWERIGIARGLAYDHYNSLKRSWRTLYVG
jgi:hypothetical protein